MNTKCAIIRLLCFIEISNNNTSNVFIYCSERICLKAKYLLTSYVSTKAMKPSGNAMAYETMAANSPSDDSSIETSKTDAND